MGINCSRISGMSWCGASLSLSVRTISFAKRSNPLWSVICRTLSWQRRWRAISWSRRFSLCPCGKSIYMWRLRISWVCACPRCTPILTIPMVMTRETWFIAMWRLTARWMKPLKVWAICFRTCCDWLKLRKAASLWRMKSRKPAAESTD